MGPSVLTILIIAVRFEAMRSSLQFVFLSVFCLAAGKIRAQVDLVNRSIPRTDSAFLFQGVVNRLEVVGVRGTAWQLRARNATVIALDSPSRFMVETDRLGPDTLQVLQKGKVVFTKIFRVIASERPVVRWGALTKATATVAEVIANRRMVMFTPGCNCPGEWHVISFSMNFVTGQSAGGKRIAIPGTAISPEAVQRVQQLRPGDKIVFEQILVVCRTCRIREWPPFVITIVGG